MGFPLINWVVLQTPSKKQTRHTESVFCFDYREAEISVVFSDSQARTVTTPVASR